MPAPALAVIAYALGVGADWLLLGQPAVFHRASSVGAMKAVAVAREAGILSGAPEESAKVFEHQYMLHFSVQHVDMRRRPVMIYGPPDNGMAPGHLDVA
jgi:hypothetical protein